MVPGALAIGLAAAALASRADRAAPAIAPVLAAAQDELGDHLEVKLGEALGARASYVLAAAAAVVTFGPWLPAAAVALAAGHELAADLGAALALALAADRAVVRWCLDALAIGLAAAALASRADRAAPAIAPVLAAAQDELGDHLEVKLGEALGARASYVLAAAAAVVTFGPWLPAAAVARASSGAKTSPSSWR